MFESAMKLQGEKLLVTLNVQCSQQTTDWVYEVQTENKILSMPVKLAVEM